MNEKSLRRTRDNRMIAGVIGGLARRYNLDPVMLRIVYVLISIFSAAFPGILVYLILWLLMPLEDPDRREDT
jgi:phage shock protein PspC (stress-responsive transcriptional regulator)